jgi:predicted phosphodiesterase
VKAIISDIHSNLEALQAVLEDIASQNVEEIYCLGDVVGYGPNPRECVDEVMRCQVVLLGNHDQGAMFDPEGFNPPAERAIFWTRAQLEAPGESRAAREKRWEFLAERPRTHREDGFLYVHGSARNPLNEYVFPEDIYNQRKMERIFALVERYCFQGHTHVPGIFTENLQFHSPEDVDYVYKLDGRKTLCNVGSVGQPRDGDWRACYIMLDGETIRYRRVEYDIETTIKKIYAIPDLENFLGDRLRDGR